MIRSNMTCRSDETMERDKTEPEGQQNKLQKTVHVLTWIFFVPFTVAVFLVLAVSFCTTIYYDLYQESDLPRFGRENVPLLVLLMLCVLAALYFLWNRQKSRATAVPVSGKRYPLSRTMKIALLWAGAVSLYMILMVRGLATNDALRLDQIVNQFMQGDFTEVTNPGGYLFVYPFQIGYVAAGQLLYVLFGASNYMVYQLLNLAAILITIRMLYQITWELFEDHIVCNLMAMLSMGLLFLFVYSTFVYGDIWSLAPETAALYLTIRYLKYHKVSDILWGGVLNGCAIVLKTNAYIALVAMVIILILDTFRSGENGKLSGKKVLQGIILAVLMVLISKGMTGMINTAYAGAIGIDTMPKGVPGSTYFAMAMQEGGGEGGWYDGYNVNTYNQSGYDWNAANQTALAEIGQRLTEFSERPLHAGRFYVRKFLSQWADPTCISMRELELTSRHVEGQPAIMYSVIYGKGRIVFSWIMNVFQSIIYLGAAIYCIDVFRRKKLEFTQAFLILFIFGGMLFHELWEGSSRYTMRYYICLLPFAAAGLQHLFMAIRVKLKNK